jgi:hypothetical protein
MAFLPTDFKSVLSAIPTYPETPLNQVALILSMVPDTANIRYTFRSLTEANRAAD